MAGLRAGAGIEYDPSVPATTTARYCVGEATVLGSTLPLGTTDSLTSALGTG
jgi:hypothetical protein